MKKMAIFVEGQSEAIFVKRLLEELGGHNNIAFEVKKIGQSLLQMKEIDPAPNYFVLIYDCGMDESVKTALLDNLNSLELTGYSAVIGLRDLHPRPIQDLPAIESFTGLTKSKLPMMVVAIKEIEAWFIAEYTHFPVYDAQLTQAHILDEIGIDISCIEFEDLPRPAKTLQKIYKLVDGKEYKKKYAQVERIVYCLDFAHFAIGVRERSAQVGKFIARIEDFLS